MKRALNVLVLGGVLGLAAIGVAGCGGGTDYTCCINGLYYQCSTDATQAPSPSANSPLESAEALKKLTATS